MLSAARLPQVRAEACISLQASWEWSKVWTPNHIRRTKSSIKKRIIVSNIRPVKNGLKVSGVVNAWPIAVTSFPCWAHQGCLHPGIKGQAQVRPQCCALKPVLNWTNVCSPEHTSDTSTNYDSFLNWTFSSPNMVRTVQTLLHSQLACNEMQASARTCGRRAADSMIENVG